ncbi:MAG: hypothetical protein BA870_06920 [Desulfuromonadales bacterium C00003094]|jgi:adenosylcobinamide-phosphate guanylyltransferase|nr:MAG: hypothetical protein BA870_06920 [Desulfuromonadales bacterium C00003094]
MVRGVHDTVTDGMALEGVYVATLHFTSAQNSGSARLPSSTVNSELIMPCGANILDESLIAEEQPDYNLILSDIEVALNVNTVRDLEQCERMLLAR